MKPTSSRELDAIAARAIHDPEMRELLTQMDLHQSDPAKLRDAMDQLSLAERDKLFQQSEELQRRTGRSNDAYLALGDYAHDRWLELMRDLNNRAEQANKDMKPALDAVRTQNADAYEHYRQKFAEEGQTMTDAVAAARNQLRRDIRREVKDSDIPLDTEARAPLVDHLTRAAPVPAAVTELMGASNRLEAAKAQHDLTMEQRRHGLAPAPKASLGF
jgi:hypothetical protein